MKGDFRLVLLIGAGVVAVAWGVTYYGAIAQLVGTGTNGYVTLIQGLEPYQARGGAGGIGGGAGNFAGNTGTLGGEPAFTTAPWG